MGVGALGEVLGKEGGGFCDLGLVTEFEAQIGMLRWLGDLSQTRCKPVRCLPA